MQKLIEKQKELIDHYQKRYVPITEFKDSKVTQQLRTEISQLEKEYEKGQEGWISVGDGLPDCGQYFATYYNPMDSIKKLYVVTIWRGRDGWYWDNSEKEPAEDKTLKVTHWQPLPSPPKQKDIEH